MVDSDLTDHLDNFNGLGLFFDTYPNSRHTYSFPRATAMLGDGKTPYDHDHDNQANELAACSVGLDCRDQADSPSHLAEPLLSDLADGFPSTRHKNDAQAPVHQEQVSQPSAPGRKGGQVGRLFRGSKRGITGRRHLPWFLGFDWGRQRCP